MEPHPDFESLSAFIDGESPEEEQIRRLVQQNEHAARTCMQYQKIGAHLQALQGPAPSPGFLARTLEAIDADQKRSRPSVAGFSARPVWAAVALAATLLLVFGLRMATSPQEGAPIAASLSDAQIVSALQQLPQEDLELAFVVNPDSVYTEGPEVAIDVLMASLAEEDGSPGYEESSDPGSLSWYDELEELEAEEQQVFTALLIEYGGTV